MNARVQRIHRGGKAQQSHGSPDAVRETSPTNSPARFYVPGHYSPDESVGYIMKRVLSSIVREAERHLEPYDLTHAQWYPLFKLKEEGKPMGTVELARELHIGAGSMTRLLDRLEKKGLCKRTRSSTDRRVVMVAPTPEGNAAATLVPAVLSDVMNAHLSGFSKTEWQTLMNFLRRMRANGASLSRSPRMGTK